MCRFVRLSQMRHRSGLFLNRGFDARSRSNRYVKRSVLTLLVALSLFALPFLVSAKKVRMIRRNPLTENIADSVPISHTDNSKDFNVKILVDGVYYIVPDRARLDSLGIPYKLRRIYICTGPYSNCYHLKSQCSGLLNCSASILSISEDSIPTNLRPCQICARKYRHIDSRQFPDSCLIRF